MRYIQSFSTSGAEQTAIDAGLLGKPYLAYLEDEHRIDWNSRTPSTPVYSAKTVTWVDTTGGTHIDTYSDGVIDTYAYWGNSDIVSAVIGDGITQIGEDDWSYVFAGCYNLSSVTIGTGVTYIGGRAFEIEFGQLHSITIPASVTGIGTNCFYHFGYGDSITFESTTPINLTMSEDGDLGTPGIDSVSIYVPRGYENTYIQAWPWYEYNIVGYGPEPTPYSAMPLTFEIVDGGYIYWLCGTAITQAFQTRTIEYNKNNEGWSAITSTSAGTPIQVSAGDIIQFRGDNNNYGLADASARRNGFGTDQTCRFKAYGNIMSLIDSTGYTEAGLVLGQNRQTDQNAYAFSNLFFNCSGLTDARNLILPSSAIPYAGYLQMFYGCANLRYGPELPDNCTVGYRAFYGMFQNCVNLETNCNRGDSVALARIPSVTFYSGGMASNNRDHFNKMFANCPNILRAFVNCASSGNTYTFNSTFSGCSNLSGIYCKVENPTVQSFSGSTPGSFWLDGVSQSGTITVPNGASSIYTNFVPSGWTINECNNTDECECEIYDGYWDGTECIISN